jgi:alkylation response protein AidB-like acyl-CoA dehydrogenase
MSEQRIPNRQELLARVAAIAPLLDQTAAESEKLRTLCPEAVEALHEAGLFGLWGPTEVGGYDTDLATQTDVMIAVARADMSACWTLMIGTTASAMMAAGLPEEGLAEVFGGPRLPTAAGSLKPSGMAEPVDGGYRVNGRWGFGSGIHHASWIMANCLQSKDGNPAKPAVGLALVIPVSEVQVEDDWFVSGLCGSGSCSYSVQDIFVPHHRTINGPPLRGGLQAQHLRTRLPLEHACVSLGGARRALDELAVQAVSKRRLLDPQSVASKQAFQIELGYLEAQWETLRAGVRTCADRLWRTFHDDQEAVEGAAVALRAVCAYATEKSLEIGGRALRQAGAAAVMDSNVLQRIHRDLTVSAQHVMISDAAYEDYGNQILGQTG